MSEEPKFRNFLKGSVAGEFWFENLFAEKLCSSQISQMRSCGTQVKVGKRQVPMYCYGCTDSVSTQPRMVINRLWAPLIRAGTSPLQLAVILYIGLK